MPRIATNRNINESYRPAVPPTPTGGIPDVIRAVWEELERISIAIAVFDQPSSMTIADTESITPAATPVWQRLFDNGVEPQWENPTGQFDPNTGIYIIPQDGVWAFNVDMRVAAFSAPGNRQYYAAVRQTIVWVDGRPDTVSTITDGGDDSVPLNVAGALTFPMSKNDLMYFDGTVVHPTVTAPQPVPASLSINRTSGLGDNVTN